jgi:hypothetical protein
MHSFVLSSAAAHFVLLCPRLELGGSVGFLVSWWLLVGSLISSVGILTRNVIQ